MKRNSIDFSYSVAIRTLGTAGDKYLATLKSSASQSIPPSKIVVYIADGYDLPKETVGIEQYVYVKKGMIAQRALPYEEIDTEWILLLDDDVLLPPNYVENALSGIVEYNADGVTANMYNHNSVRNIFLMVGVFSFPFISKKWAYKVGYSGRFNYNLKPSRHFYLTQSGPGACMLMKKKFITGIHFEDELWMDDNGYALGDDQLFHYKMYIQNAKLLLYYHNNVIHLDAGSGGGGTTPVRVYKNAQNQFMIWYRTRFDISISYWRKFLSVIAFMDSLVFTLFFYLGLAIVNRRLYFFTEYIKGTCEGKKIVNTDRFTSIPKFDRYK